MGPLNWAGIIMIGAFVALATGALVAPQDVYSGPDLQKRLLSLRSQQTRWNISKVFDGLAVALPAVGFLYAAQALRESRPGWLLTVGPAAFIVAAVTGVTYVIRLTLTPEIYWKSTKPSGLATAYLISFLFGMFAFGVAYVQAGLALWVGYLSIGASAAGLAGFLAYRSASPFYLTALLFIVNLMVGIALFRSGG